MFFTTSGLWALNSQLFSLFADSGGKGLCVGKILFLSYNDRKGEGL